MIKLSRSRHAASFPSDFIGAKLVSKHEDLVERYYAGASAGAPIEFSSSKWRSAKTALRADSSDKCAYCEAPTAVVAHGDVDHFRPKALYWWLAYNFDNFVYACQICNQSYKNDQFPVGKARLKKPKMPAALPRGNALARLAAGLSADPSQNTELKVRKLWAVEGPRLLHPYLDDPERYIAYRVDSTNKDVWIVASKAKGAKNIVQACIDVFGLNREELLRLRYSHYETLAVLYKSYRMNLPKRVKAMIEDEFTRIMGASIPFAGMNRFFVRREWKVLPA